MNGTMNWNSNDQSDSDNEMFQMSSRRIQDDSTRVRLLSVTDDEDAQELPPSNAGVPQLNFRRDNCRTTKANEKKTRCAVISILIVGVILIVMINIGLGIKFKNMPKEPTSTQLHCPVEEVQQTSQGCPASFPWQQYRLPQNIKPNSYEIFLHPNLTNSNYSGNINITISVLKATNKVILHSRDLELENVRIQKNVQEKEQNPTDIVVPQGRNFAVCKEFDFLAIFLKTDLIPSYQYTIQIEFHRDLGNSLRGFYLSKYRTWVGENRTLATTQFESTDARAAFPCFDEPRFKANFSLSIVRDKNLVALSNMPVAKSENFGDNLKLDKFQTSVAMSTYLVAFIVCDFAKVSKIIHLLDGPVTVSVYAAKERIDTALFALNISSDVLSFYESTFNISYPLPKLDLVAIPDFEAGAMENWGLVTYRETAILWNSNSSSIFDQERVALVIAHELAHQWFGNLVTMEWWNDLWLNEGFASFMEYYGVDGIRPEWNRMKQFYREHTYMAMATDESEFTHPITVPVASKVQIEEVFDDISYSKAGCVIAMIIDYLGLHEFLSGVGDYLRSFAYLNAANKDLVNSVAAKAHSDFQRKNLFDMLDSWTTEPGFPIINVSLDGDEIVLSQKRYLLSVDGEEDANCKKIRKSPVWHIPVSYKTDFSKNTSWIFFGNETDRFLLKESSKKWIIFNVGRGGYYVVNYSKDLLAKLSMQLKKNHKEFSALDRSGILFNAAKSAKIGYISYGELLDLLLYLRNEDEYLPLRTGVDIISGVLSTLKLQFDTVTYKRMKIYAKKLMQHLYIKYKWPEEKPVSSSMDHQEIKLRKLAVSLMCRVDHQHCTEKALDLFSKWRENDTQVNSDYKDIVYSTAIRLGPPGHWDFIWKKYAEDPTLDAHEKQKLLYALCYTSDEREILFLLDEAMKGEKIRFQNTRSVFLGLRSTRIGSVVAWKYMRSKWNDLLKIYPLGSFATQSLLEIFSSSIDESDLAAVKTFISVNDLTNIRFAKRAFDKAKLGVNWISAHQPQIADWLAKNLDSM